MNLFRSRYGLFSGHISDEKVAHYERMLAEAARDNPDITKPCRTVNDLFNRCVLGTGLDDEVHYKRRGANT